MRKYLRRWPELLIILLSLIAGACFLHCLVRLHEESPCQPEQGTGPDGRHCGWVDDYAAVEDVLSRRRFKSFGHTPAGRAADPLPKQVFLWDAYRKILGTLPPAKDQGNVGSCVSFGTNNAVARTLAVEVALGAQPMEFKDIAEEVTYGGSRVQVGKKQIRGDGSVGAWAAEFVNKWGVVSREKHGSCDLSVYSVTVCRKMGQSGVPADLQAVAKQSPVKNIALVKGWEDAKLSLSQGYGIAVCSNQGFTMKRDANGVCKPSGSWAHCMCLDGYVIVAAGKEYGHIENSWGQNAHTGPVGWGNPSTAGFWAESRVVDRMLRAGDSWSFSAAVGFPARKIDWFVMRPPFVRSNPLARQLLKENGYALRN